MLTITVTKDGSSRSYTLRSELENAVSRIVSEPGSRYGHEAELIAEFLRGNALFQWIARYPGEGVESLLTALSADRVALRNLQGSPEIIAATAKAWDSEVAVANALNSIAAAPWL